MEFPKPPFEIDSKSDPLLIGYLTKRNFSFLQKKTWTKISKLKKAGLREQDQILLELWPLILTDALKCLKKQDSREWDTKNKDINYSSFFHEGSLGVNELSTVLESFADFEGMLYGASPDKYRDHIAHAFRVWIIGHGILRKRSCFSGKMFSNKEFEGAISAKEWKCMWAIVALCHDLGYPLSHIEKINSRARKTLRGMGLVHATDLRFAFSPRMLPFHDTIIKMMASKPVSLASDDKKFTTHLQNKYYLKLLKSFDNLDHGIVSSLLISKALVYFLESDLAHDDHGPLDHRDARQFLIRREILRAIATHTCQDIYHLRFDTLAFLLYIVDEIQCFGRPTLEELQHPVSGIEEGHAEILAFGPNRIAIVIRTGNEKWTSEQYASAERQLSKLHRMLRLAVDTAELKDRYLEFAVVPENGEGVHLLLKNGRIKLSKVDPADLDSASLS